MDGDDEDDDDEFGLRYLFHFFKPKIGDSLFGHSNTIIDSLLTFYWVTVVHNKIYSHLHTIKRAFAVCIDSRIFFPTLTFRYYNRKRKKEKNIFAKQNSLLVRFVFIFFYL